MSRLLGYRQHVTFVVELDSSSSGRLACDFGTPTSKISAKFDWNDFR